MNMTTNSHKQWFSYNITPDVIRKVWAKPHMDEQWLTSHVETLDVVIPDRVVSFGANTSSVYVDLLYVHGMTVMEWLDQNLDNIDAIRCMAQTTGKFWVDNAASTFPYAHWDWTGANTIIRHSDHTMAMVDWDQCRIASVSDIKNRILHGIAKRYERICTFVDGSCDRMPEYINALSVYFDSKFKNIS